MEQLISNVNLVVSRKIWEREKDTAVGSNLVWIKLDSGRCLPKEATLPGGSQKCKINPKSLRTFISLHIQLKKPQNKNIFNS